MIPPADGLRLYGIARSELQLRSGDSVSVEIIRALAGGRWAVAIQGRVLPARTQLRLFPGQRLRAQVFMQDRQVTLRLLPAADSPASLPLARAGLPADEATEAIALALLRSGLSASPRNVGQVRRLLERLRLDPRRFARLAALLLEKGIDPETEGTRELISILGHGQGEGGGGKRRFRGRRSRGQAPEVTASLKRLVQDSEGQAASGLQVFNHLRGRQGTWVILPYSLEFDAGERVDGSLRLLYDEAGRVTRRFVLTARVQRGGRSWPLWSFDVRPREERLHVRCYCSEEQAIRDARGHLPGLKRKLGNLGVKADDTIHKDDAFDGFSQPGEDVSYHGVDTLG